MRWALSNSESGESKRSFSLASIEGELLHQLIQRYFERDPGQQFKQRKALLELISTFPDQHPDDKVAVKALVQRVSIQDVLLSFVKALEMIRREGGAGYSFRKKTRGMAWMGHFQGEVDGVEKWFEVKAGTVTLCGRLDYYINGILIDFKSGTAQPWHREQVAFYCALIYRTSGHLPNGARIYYSSNGVSLDVPIPTKNACDALLYRYAEMASLAAKQLNSGNVTAMPDRETCLFCPCKSGCDEYWQVVAPELMQDPELSIVDAVADVGATVSQSSAFSSVKFEAPYGPVEILFPHHTHAGIADLDLTCCRVLKARKRIRGELTSIVLTEQSEVVLSR